MMLNKIPAACLVVTLFACTKVMQGTEDASAARAFTPSALSVRTVKDSALFRWNAPLYAAGKKYSYTLDLSTDSLFTKTDYSVTTDTTAALIMDPAIALNTPYFYRVRANAWRDAGPSDYFSSTTTFRLVGQQYFKVVRDFEVTESTVLLHWYVNEATHGLTRLKFTAASGMVTEVPVTAGEASGGEKLVTDLLPDTRYTIQLLAGSKSKGFVAVTTAAAVKYTTILNPADNLANAITSAAKGDVIGLNAGTYNLTGITNIEGRHITLRSVSNNPSDTRIKVREINLVGDSAGLTIKGVEIDGNYSGTSYGAQCFQLKGTTATAGAPAAFKELRVDNCIIHDFTRCIIRGNNATAARDHRIGVIVINNSILYNVDQTNGQGYYMFSMEKLVPVVFSITRTTGYALGQGMINMSTAFTSDTIPAVTVDYCTFNNFSGGSGKYALFDANANRIRFACTNSILANTPVSGTVNSAAFRASGSLAVLSFTNNNYFNFFNASGGAALNLTGLLQSNNQTIHLGWTPATTSFKLLPQEPFIALFTASTNGSTIGDPRWAY